MPRRDAQHAPRSEKTIVDACMNYIEDMPRGHCRKVHGSRYQDAGEPDIDACVDCRCVKVEVKMPGEVPTPIQYAAMRKWERAGALVGWVTSVQELELLLTHRGDPDWINPQVCQHRVDGVEQYEGVCGRCGAQVDNRPLGAGL